jgi:hypothetical protein
MRLSVAPGKIIVPPGTSADFEANVIDVPAGESNYVSWTLSGSGCAGDTCGTLEPVGDRSVRYFAPSTAPATSLVVLTATTEAAPHISAEAEIVVSSIRVVITPDSLSLQLGHGVSGIRATVTGDSANGGVTWSVGGTMCSVTNCGSVYPETTASGAPASYDAPFNPPEPPNTQIYVRAVSVTDPYISDEMPVHLEF